MTRLPLATLAAAAAVLVAAAAGAGLAPRPAAAPPIDLLETAAPQSPRAAGQLMNSLVTAGDRLVAAGARGTIVYSDDGGRSWTQAAVPVAVMLTALHFPTPQLGWAVGHDGVILHSRDGGASWARQFDGNQANAQMLAWAQKRVEAARAALEAAPAPQREAAEDALAAAEDGLAGIEQTAGFGPSRPFMSVWFRDAREGYAVGAFGMAFATTDGGAHWALFADRLPNPEDLHLYAVASPAPKVLLIAGERGLVLRSTDAGGHWQAQADLADGGLYGLVTLPDASATLAYGFDGAVLRSTDLGASWQALDSGTRSALYGAALAGSELQLVGNNGARLRLAGERFETLPAGDGRPLTAAARGKDGWVLAGWGGLARAEAANPGDGRHE
ncbi:YCF48-related protein [Azoarcus sp. DD4]|uniref:WD40/YVTN/BNR-like repeat-containing protein n=1 Tax=Azoarcus sp. DD4 TaxID=2027405 RepID=UPI001128F8E3|nr:YCF48-related protein [Azoarcus sp. DD4]